MVVSKDKNVKYNTDANPDPITGKPGAHPVGTGVGAAGVGAVSTAVGGALGGPIGAVIGAVVGSVAGGLAGKGVAEQIDPTHEEAYWRQNYRDRDYVNADYDYDRDYSPAYRTGYEGYNQYGTQGMTYEEAEQKLQKDYATRRGQGRLDWDQAVHATRDAWDKADYSFRSYRRQDNYWRENFQSRPYVETGYTYDHYQPAYRTGYNSYVNYGLNGGMTYEQAEDRIRADYERDNGNSGLGWEKAKLAAKDAWNKVEIAVSGDDHRDADFRPRNSGATQYPRTNATY